MDKKLLIFLIVFFAFFFIWQKFVVDPYVKKNNPRPPAVTKEERQPQAQPSPQTSTPPPAPSPAVKPTTTNARLQTISIDTPLYIAEFSSKGAVLTSFRLKKYEDDFGKPLQMVPSSKTVIPLSFDFDNSQLTQIAQEANFSIDQDNLSLSGNSTGEVNFTYSDEKYFFRKSFKFKADSYLIESVVEAREGSNAMPVRLNWGPGLEDFKSYKKANVLKPSRSLAYVGGKVIRKDPPKEKDFVKIAASARWAGVENNYFASLFIPEKPSDVYMTCVKPETRSANNVVVTLVGPREESYRFRMFIGPKDYYLLQHIGTDVEQVVDFGFFGPIARVLFYALRFFYNYTHNWGWSIVLLTIVVKILFTPFMQKSFSSQKKLQQMQPEMKKIQEKYAKMKNDDPRKANMNAEVMQLHKRMGVNPLGGCLPMLIQMPVLLAFYTLLSNAIELRHAPFALWIQDLSRPDPWFVTPILMGATMLLQQKMTPSSDPMQQKMLYIMPIMFSYISLNLPSGLVLYWLLSNVLGIAHQWYFLKLQKKGTTREQNA